MSTAEENEVAEMGEGTASIRLHVNGDWTVGELERLLGAVRQIYDAGLVACLAAGEQAEAVHDQPEEAEQQTVRVELEPLSFGEPGYLTVEGSSYDVGDAVRAAIQRVSPTRSTPLFRGFSALAVAPEAQLEIKSISMASPGWIDLRGLGEPIEQLGKLIERLVRLPGKVKDDKLDREAKAQAKKAKAERDGIEIARARMAAIADFLRLQERSDFRSLPGMEKQIQDILPGVQSISDLARSGHLLPPPAGP